MELGSGTVMVSWMKSPEMARLADLILANGVLVVLLPKVVKS